MFRRSRKGNEVEFPIVLLNPHVTSPNPDEPAIIRNDLNLVKNDGPVELYERARQIYDRARRSGRRRSAGII